MKTFSLLVLLTAVGAASSILLPAFEASGQTTVATAPVGYLQTSCLSNSDTLVAPPFTRPAAFTGAVSSISSTSTTATVTLNSTGLTADAYDAPTTTPPTKDTYYLSIGPNTAALGGTVSVTANSTTVTGTGTSFGAAGSVQVGDRITINDGVNLLTYAVTAIPSTTVLTLDRAFSDTAATGTTSAATPVTTARSGRTVILGGSTAKPLATAGTTTLSGLSATFDHSPYEGRFYQIVSNATGTVTVNLNGDSLSSVAAGTQVSIIPYWTLNSIFPASAAGVSFTATTDSHDPQTQILIPNYSGAGVNLSAALTYLYYNGHWHHFDNLSTDQGYEPLLPDGYFTVRNPDESPTLPVVFSGAVPVNKLVTMLATNSSQSQDNAVALNRPADVPIKALGLNPADGSFQATTDSHDPQDELLVYNNASAAFNKSASTTYLYYSSGTNVGWRLFSDLNTDHGTDVIPAGSAFTIRKAPATSGQTVVWTNTPNY